MAQVKKPVLLMILDGLGLAPASRGNAFFLASMPFLNKLIGLYPSFSLRTSGEAVGLTYNEPGNSEVGHLNLGAGKIVWQNLPRINRSIAGGDFFKNPVLLETIAEAKKRKSKLHLLGLVSDGNVHSSLDHLFALLEFLAQEKQEEVYLHLFLDGRDTVYNAGFGFIEKVLEKTKKLGIGEIASLSGRFYAMDRDNQWERVKKAYQAMTKGEGQKFSDPLSAIKSSYEKRVYDEEFEPVVISRDGKPVSLISENDLIIFFNFRPDRARQITHAFLDDDFKGWGREKLKNLYFVTMTLYEKDLKTKVVFPEETVEYPLARVISEAGFEQLHIAETQKYPHVTYFFNGGREEPFPGETRVLIPSLAIASFAEKPEMSAKGVSEGIANALNEEKYSFMIVNFANPDMVAHTGDLKATIKCLEFLDGLLSELIPLALAKNWTTLILADHGNAEELINLQTGEIDKEHSTNPVPLIVVSKEKEGQSMVSNLESLANLTPTGILADVSPTILKIMGLPKPKEMEGIPLI